MNINSRTYKKIDKFNGVVNLYNKWENKLGGPGLQVQIDETTLNHKIKAHRGRAARNKTDAICIVEVEDRITRAFACVIPNKKSDTIIPIIVENVEKGSLIWTDEHKSYGRLSSLGCSHDSVCHNKKSIYRKTGSNTKAVESFNNEVNLEIKRSGIKTDKRQKFLDKFVWKFNNQPSDRIIKILYLIRIKNL